jgi:phosphoribosylanthranilate isomerase
MKFVVKICGVTRPEDAAHAAAEGATAIGLNFWRGSKRFVEDGQAREILSVLPATVLRIGVFVNAHPLSVTETLADLGLDMVQLHGDEKVGSWSEIPPKRIVRAIRVYDAASMKEALAWDPAMFVYDARTPSFGGAGVTAPWSIIAAEARRPFLLAGGLNSGNVHAAIEAVRPDGVDAASGVESSPGIKEKGLLSAFIRAAITAAHNLGVGST